MKTVSFEDVTYEVKTMRNFGKFFCLNFSRKRRKKLKDESTMKFRLFDKCHDYWLKDFQSKIIANFQLNSLWFTIQVLIEFFLIKHKENKQENLHLFHIFLGDDAEVLWKLKI